MQSQLCRQVSSTFKLDANEYMSHLNDEAWHIRLHLLLYNVACCAESEVKPMRPSRGPTLSRWPAASKLRARFSYVDKIT
jgi:hypothetical protein